MKKTLFLLLSFCVTFSFINAQQKDSILYPKGLKVVSKAPLFATKDNYGNDFILQETYESSPVVLLFYQGFWSRPCYEYLKQVSDSLLLLDQKAAVVIGVSPEQGKYVAQSEQNANVQFQLINDTDMKICKQYKVNYKLDAESIAHLKTLNVDLIEINGSNTGNQLPVTAVYIINRDGYIVYKYFDTDVTHRPSVWELANKLSDTK
jgi:peroxiredoxin